MQAAVTSVSRRVLRDKQRGHGGLDPCEHATRMTSPYSLDGSVTGRGFDPLPHLAKARGSRCRSVGTNVYMLSGFKSLNRIAQTLHAFQIRIILPFDDLLILQHIVCPAIYIHRPHADGLRTA